MNDPLNPAGHSLPGGRLGAPASLQADKAEPAQTQARTSSANAGAETSGEGTRTGRRSRSRGGRRRRRSSASANASDDGAGDSATRTSADDGSADGPGRSSRGREPARSERTTRDGGDSAGNTSTSAADGAKPARKRRRRRKSVVSTDKDREAPAPSDAEEGTKDPDARPRRRRGSRGGRGRKKSAHPAVVDAIPGEEDDLPELDEFVRGRGSEDDGPSGSSAKGAKKATRKRAVRKTEPSEEKREAQEAARTQSILVNATEPDEVRVAVAEDGRLADFQMTVDRYKSLVNDIYRGRVVNIEAAIGAAFIDFGQGRNGFLHASDVLSAYGDKDWKIDKLLTTRVEDDEWETDADTVDSGNGRSSKASKKRRTHHRSRPRLAITDLFKKGQMVAAQITKDAIGDKGPTLTTYISIPGRYLVLMPSLARTGVSRKIEDEKERRRLKRILSTLDIPDGMGVIVRTAGIGKTKTELRRDLDYLMAVWEDFGKRLVSGRNPSALYQESSVAIRTMRDLFSSTTKEVVVDDEEVHREMVEFAERLMPEHVDRIKLHKGPRPLFHTYGLEQEFERMFARRVELPSGGSIVVDQTEALVAIDVNSGRTREDGAGFEDIALKANLEAAPEIARQIRLRDLGGILVLDFIDMMRPASRRAVEKAFRDALATDRARSKVGRISQFGLLEMTRQRLGPGLSKLIYDPCPTCRGSGRQRTAGSRAIAVLRRLGSAVNQKGFSTIEVRAHPEVIEYLENELSEELEALSSSENRELQFTEVPGQVEDSVLRYLRTDGREVRPGGRRKR
jgi:ribonuclease E